MRGVIGQSAGRRHLTIASASLWALGCGAVVVIAHALTGGLGSRLGPYRSGLITLALFIAAALYSLRKRWLGLSVRLLRLTYHLPRPLAVRIDLLDRLESWRAAHLTLGIAAMLPFWWHVEAGPAGTLELVLKTAVVLLVLSGFVGVLFQEMLPRRIRIHPDFEVRLEDVEEGLHALYVQAEETILGHSEELVHAYLRNIRPIMGIDLPARTLLWATLTGADPTLRACNRARLAAADIPAAESAVYDSLLGLARRKVHLEHNGFALQLNSAWLRAHIVLALATFVLIAFHVVGALYFGGL